MQTQFGLIQRLTCVVCVRTVDVQLEKKINATEQNKASMYITLPLHREVHGVSGARASQQPSGQHPR